MKTKSRTGIPVPQDESPRHLLLVDLLVDTRTELFELALRSGLRVFTAMLEEDRTAICGPRYAHCPERIASRAGTVPSEVVLAVRKVAIPRPRVRTAEGEVPLPTFQTMAATDPLDRRVIEQMLVGVATRQYPRSLESLGPASSRPRSRRHTRCRHPAPLHPEMGKLYHDWVIEARDGLNDADRRDGATIALRSMVEEIVLTPEGDKLGIVLKGDLAAMLAAASPRSEAADILGASSPMKRYEQSLIVLMEDSFE